MRELKFRAWRNIDGKLRRYVFSPFAYEYPDPDEPVFHAEHGVNDIRDFMPLADIIEQYTGLKDKNGKEIYEGDIVRYAFEYSKGEWVEEVSFGKISDGEGYYHDYFLAWRTTDKDGDGHQSLLDLEGYCEVIGNIHENPELLEDEE